MFLFRKTSLVFLLIGAVVFEITTIYPVFSKRLSGSAIAKSNRRQSGGQQAGNGLLYNSISRGRTFHDDDDSTAELSSGHSLNQLLDIIFMNYHKELVPTRPTVIKMDLLLLKVKSTVEKEGIFESVVAIFIEWTDSRLIWQPSKYGNVTVLAFDSDKVWLPDIAMTNSADHLYSISKDIRFVVRVSHTGYMKFVPTGTARTWCDLKLLHFPFDIQTCSLEFESWSLDSSTMTFNNASEALVDEAFASPQWALCSRNAVVYDHFYNFTGETFTRVRFDFKVRRKSTFYIINLIFPCATLSLIQLLVFVIPSTDSTSDRVGFGTTNLLTLVVFQTIVTEEMPKSSDAVTSLSKYIISLIIISAVGIFESVIVERMLRTTSSPPPKWTIKILRIVPLLWSPQMPTGITHMVLQSAILPEESQKRRLAIRDKIASCCNKSVKEDEELSMAEQRPLDPIPSRIVITRAEETNVKTELPSASGPSRPTSLNFENNVIAPCYFRRASKDESFIFTSLHRRIDKVVAAPAKNNNEVTPAPVETLQAAMSEGETSSYNWGNLESPACSEIKTTMGISYQSPDNLLLLGFSPSEREISSSFVYYGEASKEDEIYNRVEETPKKVGTIVFADELGRNAVTKTADSNSNKEALLVCTSDMEKPVSKEKPSNMSNHRVTRIRNGTQWGKVVTKLDTLAFLICAALAVGIPSFLFLPSILEDMQCGQ